MVKDRTREFGLFQPFQVEFLSEKLVKQREWRVPAGRIAEFVTLLGVGLKLGSAGRSIATSATCRSLPLQGRHHLGIETVDVVAAVHLAASSTNAVW